jgi:Fe-S cluster assembly ATP-binding protein
MLKFKNLSVSLSSTNKEILKNINLEINPGEVHLLSGRNGSGKSTLVNTTMGNPSFEVTKGEITLVNEKYTREIIEKIDVEFIKDNSFILSKLEPNERSLLGIFLANQYPVEIPGVNLSSYLRMIYNTRRSKENALSVFKFKQLLEEKASLINYPLELLKRNLNEGFSGGEKKKTEILQMLILEPRYVMLDEIDSGLDKHAVKEVFEGLLKFKELFPKSAIIIITHYERFREYIQPDYIHEIDKGIINS